MYLKDIKEFAVCRLQHPIMCNSDVISLHKRTMARGNVALVKLHISRDINITEAIVN